MTSDKKKMNMKILTAEDIENGSLPLQCWMPHNPHLGYGGVNGKKNQSTMGLAHLIRAHNPVESLYLLVFFKSFFLFLKFQHF